MQYSFQTGDKGLPQRRLNALCNVENLQSRTAYVQINYINCTFVTQNGNFNQVGNFNELKSQFAKRSRLNPIARILRQLIGRAVLFGAVHSAVAFGTVSWMTGDLAVGGTVAAIDPIVNMSLYLLFGAATMLNRNDDNAYLKD